MRQPILTPHPLSSGRTDLFKRLWFSPLARLRGGGEGEALGFTRFLIRKTKPSPLTPLPQAGEGNKSAPPQFHLSGVLLTHNRLAGFGFQFEPGFLCHAAATPGYILMF